MTGSFRCAGARIDAAGSVQGLCAVRKGFGFGKGRVIGLAEQKVLLYKGKPLIRQGNFLFYGNPDDKYILFMNVLETKKEGDLEVATRVLVQIQDTDDEKSFNEKVLKQCEKRNLYDALDIGVIWLERALKS